MQKNIGARILKTEDINWMELLFIQQKDRRKIKVYGRSSETNYQNA